MRKWWVVVVLVGLSLLVACSAQDDGVESQGLPKLPDKFVQQFDGVIDAYLEIQGALAEGNASLAAEKARNLAQLVGGISPAELPSELRAVWNRVAGTLSQSAATLAAAAGIEEQRTAFGELSDAMVECVRNFGPGHHTLYMQHCPMAFNEQGGSWMSDKPEVRNPYFGHGMMYQCGSVQETFAGK